MKDLNPGTQINKSFHFDLVVPDGELYTAPQEVITVKLGDTFLDSIKDRRTIHVPRGDEVIDALGDGEVDIGDIVF